MRQLATELKPVWLFDRGGYVWNLQPGRNISIIRDQLENFIVYDDMKMVSRYYKVKEEAQAFAHNYIVEEIINKYYSNLKLLK